jgi:hypothetical protein
MFILSSHINLNYLVKIQFRRFAPSIIMERSHFFSIPAIPNQSNSLKIISSNNPKMIILQILKEMMIQIFGIIFLKIQWPTSIIKWTPHINYYHPNSRPKEISNRKHEEHFFQVKSKLYFPPKASSKWSISFPPKTNIKFNIQS